MPVQFQAGRTYLDRSACDHECVFTMTVLSRTAATITTKIQGGVKKLRVSVYDDVEQVKPFGSYSMCSIMRADKIHA